MHGTKRAEKGFTLIETLLSLLIFMISLPFIVYLFSTMESDSQIEALSVEQFFILLRNEMLLSVELMIENGQLTYKNKTNQTVSIHQYNNLIRRQVNKQGHEIYLNEIKEFTLFDNGNHILITVTSLDGNKHEKVVSYVK